MVKRFTIKEDTTTGKLIPVPVTGRRFVIEIEGTAGKWISIAEPLPEGYEETDNKRKIGS
ncbi:unnamed protein product [marine sediment metagenome]|uniref:Uncharacterized protein n=1 Tax=marine sediment metagenome TaxID=412755 RepID=X1QHU2_9ZZZZ